MNELVQMGIDLYYGKTDKFSKDETNEALRKALIDICGGKIDYKSMRLHKNEVFAYIEETLDVLIPRLLDGQFDPFVETRNTAWGDQLIFDVTDNSLFTVATIANGTNNLRRQRLDRGSFALTTAMEGIKIYEELYRFLAGRIDWAEMINRVAASFALKIKTDIYNAIYNSYSSLNATYKANGAFSTTTFDTLVAHVSAQSNSPVTVFGTKLSLGKVTANSGYVSYNMMDKINASGYLGEFHGTPLVELQQAHQAGTNNFVISDSFLLIVPTNNEKIVKLGFEGDAIVEETTSGNSDGSLEYLFKKMYGVSVFTTSAYGVYQPS